MERTAQEELTIVEAATSADFAVGRAMFEEYSRAIDIDLCFQDFAAELDRLSVMYAPPAGALLLARSDSGVAGCAGLRKLRDDICEMKRLYVRPEFRGRGLGRRMAEEIALRARELDYRTLVLDTLGTMEAAQGLYVSMGFKPATSYYVNPLPNVKYFSLDLQRR
ncbi:MAG TPA: GNAT family N-acetyltransferase [Vicinamibacterales bacterium]